MRSTTKARSAGSSSGGGLEGEVPVDVGEIAGGIVLQLLDQTRAPG